jgi:hypothetical protein
MFGCFCEFRFGQTALQYHPPALSTWAQGEQIVSNVTLPMFTVKAQSENM